MKFAHFSHVWNKPGLVEFNFSDLPEADLMRSIRLFGERVMPALRDFEPF